jgi:hypothetical protein
MKSAAVILLFLVSLVGGALALQAKDAFTPSLRFAFNESNARRALSSADAGSAVETVEAQALPALPRLPPHSLQVVGR